MKADVLVISNCSLIGKAAITLVAFSFFVSCSFSRCTPWTCKDINQGGIGLVKQCNEEEGRTEFFWTNDFLVSQFCDHVGPEGALLSSGNLFGSTESVVPWYQAIGGAISEGLPNGARVKATVVLRISGLNIPPNQKTLTDAFPGTVINRTLTTAPIDITDVFFSENSIQADLRNVNFGRGEVLFGKFEFPDVFAGPRLNIQVVSSSFAIHIPHEDPSQAVSVSCVNNNLQRASGEDCANLARNLSGGGERGHRAQQPQRNLPSLEERVELPSRGTNDRATNPPSRLPQSNSASDRSNDRGAPTRAEAGEQRQGEPGPSIDLNERIEAFCGPWKCVRPALGIKEVCEDGEPVLKWYNSTYLHRQCSDDGRGWKPAQQPWFEIMDREGVLEIENVRDPYHVINMTVILEFKGLVVPDHISPSVLGRLGKLNDGVLITHPLNVTREFFTFKQRNDGLKDVFVNDHQNGIFGELFGLTLKQFKDIAFDEVLVKYAAFKLERRNHQVNAECADQYGDGQLAVDKSDACASDEELDEPLGLHDVDIRMVDLHEGGGRRGRTDRAQLPDVFGPGKADIDNRLTKAFLHQNPISRGQDIWLSNLPQGELKITLLDPLGKIVREERIINAQEEYILQAGKVLSNQGLYYICIRNNFQSIALKLLVRH